ncbi:ABC transporter ATP-binding protein [Microbacterium saperdae]
MTLLRLSEVAAGYDGARAVSDIDLQVDAGQIVALVGESGSGKTTIGRIVAGFLSPSEGAVSWRGERLLGVRSRALRRDIQVVFQDPYLSLNPYRTVGSVLGELLRATGVPRSDVRAHIGDLLARVSLSGDVAASRPSELSGGQLQRVAIARALATRPSLIIADEPTSALDVSVQAAILELFAGLRSELGTSLLVITHDLGVVERLSDRVVVLQSGSIVEEGRTPDVLDHANHPYTRRLLDAVPRLPESSTDANAS